MNRKFEDDLVKLAFEDTSVEEARVLEQNAGLDPEAVLALAQYRLIRSELKNLADVPPDQLSKERLREAILARGLKEKPKSSVGFGWAWMPALAAGFALVVMVTRPHPTTTPRVVAVRGENPFKIDAVAPAARVATNFAPAAPASTALSDSGNMAKKRVRLVLRAFDERRGRKGSPSKADQAFFKDYYLSVIEPGLEAETQSASSVPSAENTLAASPAAPTVAAASTPPPIVLIDGEKDGSTGTSKATEVDSARNVVIGG